ncbi:hypothetical protein TorRG33x02_106570 [Trema orientale]|uniref:Transmembrane protein n=1 Tax=Trema orientale TaxID=63057 RepID=A0A2P5F793_TREOI|nr:hypothetical protein TorRG33x02_106570 [Trema orientale]
MGSYDFHSAFLLCTVLTPFFFFLICFLVVCSHYFSAFLQFNVLLYKLHRLMVTCQNGQWQNFQKSGCISSILFYLLLKQAPYLDLFYLIVDMCMAFPFFPPQLTMLGLGWCLVYLYHEIGEKS